MVSSPTQPLSTLSPAVREAIAQAVTGTEPLFAFATELNLSVEQWKDTVPAEAVETPAVAARSFVEHVCTETHAENTLQWLYLAVIANPSTELNPLKDYLTDYIASRIVAAPPSPPSTITFSGASIANRTLKEIGARDRGRIERLITMAGQDAVLDSFEAALNVEPTYRCHCTAADLATLSARVHSSIHWIFSTILRNTHLYEIYYMLQQSQCPELYPIAEGILSMF